MTSGYQVPSRMPAIPEDVIIFTHTNTHYACTHACTHTHAHAHTHTHTHTTPHTHMYRWLMLYCTKDKDCLSFIVPVKVMMG